MYKIGNYKVWACGPHGQFIGSNELMTGAPIELAENYACGLFYESMDDEDWDGWTIDVLSEDGIKTVYSEDVDELLRDHYY